MKLSFTTHGLDSNRSSWPSLRMITQGLKRLKKKFPGSNTDVKLRPGFLFLTACCIAASTAQAGNRPAWRGPNANGVADPGQSPPLVWSDSENVIWKTPVPGRGHSTPIVMGSRIFLTSANKSEEVQTDRNLLIQGFLSGRRSCRV